MPPAPASAPANSTVARPTALVTGGGRRLGSTIVRALARAGWHVAIHHHHSKAEAQALAAELQAQGMRAQAFGLDLDGLEAGTASAFMAEVGQALGPVGLLVNSASRFSHDTPTQVQAKALASNMATNLAAPVLLTQALHAEVAHSPRPAAVAIHLLDQKLDNPNPDFFAYTLSKAALAEAVRLQAMAMAPAMRVLAVSPGITLPSADQTEAEFQQAHSQTPLRQSSTADEIAEAIVWLAKARAITGTRLLVDGGQHLHPIARDIMFLSREHS